MSGTALLRGWLTCVVFILGLTPFSPQAFATNKPTPANGKLVVHVIDASGSPREGAMVRLFIEDQTTLLLTDTGREIRSDESGRAIFDHLATDQWYFLRAVVGDRLLAYHGAGIHSDKPTQEVELNLCEPRSAIVHIHDEQGKPIAGVTVSEVSGYSTKTSLVVAWPDLAKVGIIAAPSNAAGELVLRRLPDVQLELQLRHSAYAPASIDKLATTPGSVNNVAMSPGATVELQFRLPKGVSHVENLKVHWPEVQGVGSRRDVLPLIVAGGKVDLAVKPGKYRTIYINHPEFIVTPEYRKVGEEFELRRGVNVFTFDVRAKTKVHGRVLDQSTGKPLGGVRLFAYTISDKISGQFADFVFPWTITDDATTGPGGDYELRIPAGPGLVSLFSKGLTAQHGDEKINVAADGSTVVPDILVHPIPSIHGVVRDPDGRPVPRAVVRFRNSELTYLRDPPALADSNGRFELLVDHIPKDWTSNEPQPVQTILAFDPYRPLGVVAQVNLSDEPRSILDLRLRPQDFSFAVTGFPDEAKRAMDISSAARAYFAGMARGGMPAPELDGAVWLNTPKRKMSLADFRGKYLLLHFWTTWCPGCPPDLRSVEVADRLYRDKGLAIVCVHDNSVPISEIKQYVADHKIYFPVVIDQPDGRIKAAYKPLGAWGYPTDVLVGPDGRIVGHPPDQQRARFRIELLRQELMSQSAAVDAESPAEGRLLVRVVDAAGSPRANALIRLFIRKKDSGLLTDTGREIRSDASGRAEFDHLATDVGPFLRATRGDRLVGYQSAAVGSDKAAREIEIHIAEARSATIHVHDEQGQPIAGATVWQINGESAEAWFRLEAEDLPKVGVTVRPSNAAGDLTLDRLPVGKIEVRLIHPKYAATFVESPSTAPGSVTDVAKPRGAIVELHFRLPSGVAQVENLTFHWVEDMTARTRMLPTVHAGQVIELALKPGKHSSLEVSHPDFLITPWYGKLGHLFELGPGRNVFTFDIREKVLVHGKVLNKATGKPRAGVPVVAATGPSKIDGPFADFAGPLTPVDDDVRTDERGQYELRLPAGPAEVSMYADGLMADHDVERINVAADGSTIVPDILVQPIPHIHGVVRDPHGLPVAQALVRFRGSDMVLTDFYPVVTDAAGRFELTIDHFPRDFARDMPQPVQTILAFDPYRPLGAVARVDFSKPKSLENLDLRLSPQDYNFPVTGFPEETAWARTNLSPESIAEKAKMARGGAVAAELDGAAWLNISTAKISLADLRGKYVLLHFWTTWCSHCPEDFPYLDLAQKLYGGKGLTIIFVHDNSVPIAEIKQYVAHHKIHFPVVIDRPDGRILAAYSYRGADRYPSDVLIGPDGRIIGHPPEKNRVLFRFELLRQELMSPLAGIGVALKIEDGKVLVNLLMPNSAAARSGALHPNDRIVAVGEADGEPKNLAGLDVRQAAGLIRGRPGTHVRLMIIPAGKNESAAQVVSLVRGDVSLAGGIRLSDGKLVLPGTIAPDFSFTRMDGSQADLDSLRGKIVVLEIWASWCKPCVELVGRMQSLRTDHPEWNGQVEILFASVDDQCEKAVECAKAHHWTAITPIWSGPELANDYCTSGVPATFIIDRDGRVVAAGKPGSDLDIAKTIRDKNLLTPKSK